MKNLIPYPNYIKSLEGAPVTVSETVISDALRADEYHINCADGVALVTAGSKTATFYAEQTIKQLKAGADSFSPVEIKDKPAYEYRGFMLDSGRHFWTVAKIKQILDVMAALKYNYFHWHLTEDQGWRAEIKKYPELTEKGAIRAGTPRLPKDLKKHDGIEYGRGLFYTQDDMREVVAYAAERHIEVVPEIDMPGHLVAAIACYPNLSCTGEPVEVASEWGVLDNIGCCGKDDIYDFVKDIIDELVKIFPGKYFHIGGDEVPKTRWKQCAHCQAKIKELGLKDENALQGYFNDVIAKYLVTKNRIMIGWNEILETSYEVDKEIITQFYSSGRPKELDEFVKQRLDTGGKILLSPTDIVYMDHPYSVRPLEKTYKISPEGTGCLYESENIIGIEAPQWTEFVATEEKFDFNTFPRLAAIAEASWTNNENKNYNCFESRLEAMRPMFKGFGIELPPKKYYSGKALRFSKFRNGWKAAWRKNPNLELELWKKRKD